MRAHEFLDQASSLVKGDRERQHGDKLDNFENIAAVWEGAIRRIIYSELRLHVPQGWLKGEHVGDLMECLKVARRWEGEFNPDDHTDGAGYAGCSGEIRSRKRAFLAGNTHEMQTVGPIRPTEEPEESSGAAKCDYFISGAGKGSFRAD